MYERFAPAQEQQDQRESPLETMKNFLTASDEDRKAQRDMEFGGEEWNPDYLTDSDRQAGFKAIWEAIASLNHLGPDFNAEYVEAPQMQKVIMALHVEQQCQRVTFTPIGQQNTRLLTGVILSDRGDKDFLIGYDGMDTMLYRLPKGGYATYIDGIYQPAEALAH